MCAGFNAGSGNAHQLPNKSDAMVVYLEVGDRTAGDVATHPDDDVRIDKTPDVRLRTFTRMIHPFEGLQCEQALNIDQNFVVVS